MGKSKLWNYHDKYQEHTTPLAHAHTQTLFETLCRHQETQKNIDFCDPTVTKRWSKIVAYWSQLKVSVAELAAWIKEINNKIIKDCCAGGSQAYLFVKSFSKSVASQLHKRPGKHLKNVEISTHQLTPIRCRDELVACPLLRLNLFPSTHIHPMQRWARCLPFTQVGSLPIKLIFPEADLRPLPIVPPLRGRMKVSKKIGSWKQSNFNACFSP